MYSESDLDHAVATGALTPEAAAALRQATAASRGQPAADEESFRLITGFNDIFVSLAALLVLVAAGWIGSKIGWRLAGGMAHPHDGAPDVGTLAGFGVATAATAWALAEYFTRVRRMALPSILLLLAFAGGVALAATIAGYGAADPPDSRALALASGIGGLVTAGAVWLHWRRFRVPITVAALTCALAATLYAFVLAALPAARSLSLVLLMAAGLAIFAYAMWWDMSDRERRTRRSDVAFWLHLAAAPTIAHPLFALLGLLDGEVGGAQALLVLALYVAFGVVALAVDRRALLVSSLFYVLYALSALFRQFGAVNLNVALTALLIGSALLVLSAFWQRLRGMVVRRLPADWQRRLPALDRVAPRQDRT